MRHNSSQMKKIGQGMIWTCPGFECYHLSMLPMLPHIGTLAPLVIKKNSITRCYIFQLIYATLHHLTNCNGYIQTPRPIPRKPPRPAVPLLGFVSGCWSRIAPPSALLLPWKVSGGGACRDPHTTCEWQDQRGFLVVVIYSHIGANLHPNVRILWNIQP